MKKYICLFLTLIIIPVMVQAKVINNLSDYFEYLPNEIHNNWSPYKANKDYEVTVQFVINKNGEISELQIINSTNERANTSVLNAVKKASPFKPLPNTYKRNTLRTQVELQFKNHDI